MKTRRYEYVTHYYRDWPKKFRRHNTIELMNEIYEELERYYGVPDDFELELFRLDWQLPENVDRTMLAALYITSRYINHGNNNNCAKNFIRVVETPEYIQYFSIDAEDFLTGKRPRKYAGNASGILCLIEAAN